MGVGWATVNCKFSLVIPDGRKAEPGSGNPGASAVPHLQGHGLPDPGSALRLAGMTIER